MAGTVQCAPGEVNSMVSSRAIPLWFMMLLRRRRPWLYAAVGVPVLLLSIATFEHLASGMIGRRELQLLLPAVDLFEPAAIHRDFFDEHFDPLKDPALGF